MAVTASALQTAQYKLAEMFASPNISQTESLEGSAVTAAAMLRRQTAKTVDRAVGGKVTGWQAWFIRPAAEDHADTSAPGDCDVPTGNGISTVKGDYSTTVLARTDATVTTNRSDNLVMTADEMAAQIQHMMVKLRKRLNTGVVIPALTAAGQSNMDDFINSTWDDTSAAPRNIVTGKQIGRAHV